MKKRLPTVTIAVSAYNEEKNIGKWLESVLDQKEEGFKLKQIWVFNDGSDDETVKVVKAFKSRKVKVFDDRKRLGKSSRLNQIYQKLDTDFLVQTDADVIFSHEYVVRDMIQPLIKDPKVGMCGGNPRPLAATTFTERAVNRTVEAYLDFRAKVKGGNNVMAADGRILAYRRELTKKIHVPEDMICNDTYTYFVCLEKGYKFKHVPSAIVWFRSPQTLRDHIRQMSRFKASPVRMSKYFPKELVEKERAIPRGLFVKNLVVQFIKDPIACSYIFAVNQYCAWKARKNESKMTAKWEMAESSKVLADDDKEKIKISNKEEVGGLNSEEVAARSAGGSEGEGKIPQQVETSPGFKSVRDDTTDLKSLSVVSSEDDEESKAKYQKQENKDYFGFDRYVHEERWTAYYHQIQLVQEVAQRLGKKAISVLEIGPADKSVASVLQSQGMKVVTMDIDPELNPDYVGALPEIPVDKPKKFDCILCCQTLEHIEYGDSEKALAEMARRAKYAVISVPHKGINFLVRVKLWFLPTWKWGFTFPSPRKHLRPGNHYWELEAAGFPEKRWRESIKKAGFEIVNDYRMPEFTFFHFYVLRSEKFK